MKSSLIGEVPLLRLAVCLMAGIVAGCHLPDSLPWLAIFIGLIAVALLLRRYAMWQSISIAVCFVVLGILLVERQMQTERVGTEVVQQNPSRLERSKTYFLQLRGRLLQRLADQGMTGDEYAVVAAMALGDKSALTRELKSIYAVTGASHVLALSGLHLGIIYSLLSLLIVGRRWRMLSQLVCILSIWAFVFLVGMSVSVVRSALMLTVYALMSLGHRDKMSVNTLAFTAIVMLMVQPLSLFDIGFQMSFMAVFSILVLMPQFDRVFSQEYLMSHPLVRWLWSMLAVSCAAQLGVAPLIAYYFGHFSTYFLLTNLVVVPAATLILYLSLAVLVVPSLAYLLIYIVGLLNAALLYLASIPGASIDGLHPTVLQVVMVYVIIASLWLLTDRLKKQHHQRRDGQHGQ
ncbi:MAG: ComEC/Rec2 family competence protein [Prevotella sp.]|nr:ComEC/Rec2 family competence protein [Prevotella sp.]